MRSLLCVLLGRFVALRFLCVLGCASVEFPAQSQGTVHFSTRAAGVNAYVVYLGDNTLADGRFYGQLYGAAEGKPLAPLGTPVPFRSDAGKGYITSGGVVEIPGVAPGAAANVKLVAWHWSGDYGVTDYEIATHLARTFGGWPLAESSQITVVAGGGILPPARLSGLIPFGIPPAMPEPSALALMGVGTTVLLRFGRKGGPPA